MKVFVSIGSGTERQVHAVDDSPDEITLEYLDWLRHQVKEDFPTSPIFIVLSNV